MHTSANTSANKTSEHEMPINKKFHQVPEMTPQSPECRQHYYAVMSRSVSASGTGTSEARQWQLWCAIQDAERRLMPPHQVHPVSWCNSLLYLYFKLCVQVILASASNHMLHDKFTCQNPFWGWKSTASAVKNASPVVMSFTNFYQVVVLHCVV